MSELKSDLSSPIDDLNINDSAEGHNEDLEYDEEDMRGETLWNDLTNLHKEVIKSFCRSGCSFIYSFIYLSFFIFSVILLYISFFPQT
jgi:hypothetical protein